MPDSGSTVQFTAHIKDGKPERNYYRIRLKTVSSRSYFFDGCRSPWYEQTVEEDIVHRNDPILSGHVGGSVGDDFYGIGDNTDHYSIFTDKTFAGTEAKISFTANNRISTGEYYDDFRAVIDTIVSLLSISQAEFEYLSILNVLYGNEYDSSGMLEPVTLPVNVVNGTGFVSVFMPSTISPRLLEKY